MTERCLALVVIAAKTCNLSYDKIMLQMFFKRVSETFIYRRLVEVVLVATELVRLDDSLIF